MRSRHTRITPAPRWWILLAPFAFLLLLAVSCGPAGDNQSGGADGSGASGATQRLAFVQSYWNNYTWTLEIEVGLLESCGLPVESATAAPEVVDGIGRKHHTFQRNGRTIELLMLYMDTKRRPGDEWLQQSGDLTRAMLEEFRPDVVILADDNANRLVGPPLAKAGTAVVFCGVNADYRDYYAAGLPVTGFHERLNYRESFAVLAAMCPNVKHTIFITDNTSTSAPIAERVLKAGVTPPVESVHRVSSMAEFQQLVQAAQAQPDTALAIFNLNFDDATQEQAIAWMFANSSLPEVTFQRNTVEGGLLCASSISGHVHGTMATGSALKILDGTDAASIPVVVPPRGEDMVNVLRARKLGVSIPAELRGRVTAIQVATALQAGDREE